MRKKGLTAKEFGKKLRKELTSRPKPAPPMERKAASVTAFRSFNHIHSLAIYRSAQHDPQGYNQVFSPEVDEKTLGNAARAALEASRFITPDHTDWDWFEKFPTDEDLKELENEDKVLAGVKTRKALFNGAGYVSLRLQDGQLEIKPWRYRGNGHWEGGELEPVILSETVSDAEFGAAIKEAVKVSRAA